METRFANILSVILHPLLVPLCTMLVIFNFNTIDLFTLNLTAKILLLVMMITATLAFPMLIFSILHKRGVILSYKMETREERLYPCIIMAILYYLMYTLFSFSQLPDIFSYYMLGATILVLLVVIINFRWKISIHMVAIGGMTGLFAGISGRLSLDLELATVLTILAAGLAGYARLRTEAHKPAEIYFGYLLGLTVMMGITFLIR